VNSFKDFFNEVFNPHINKKTGELRKHRHMADIIPDVSTHSATGGKTVPEYCKSNNNAVQEFEALKRMNSGTKTITLLKARKLKDQFKLSDFRGNLGNTGIFLAPHHEPGFFTLTK
jgi:hypothetical protein